MGRKSFLINGRKGQSHIWAILMAFVIAFVVMVIMLSWFKGAGEKGLGSVDAGLDSLGDCDNDGIPNFYDKCPYTYGVDGAEFKGCPSSVISEDQLAGYQSGTCVDSEGSEDEKDDDK